MKIMIFPIKIKFKLYNSGFSIANRKSEILNLLVNELEKLDLDKIEVKVEKFIFKIVSLMDRAEIIFLQ